MILNRFGWEGRIYEYMQESKKPCDYISLAEDLGAQTSKTPGILRNLHEAGLIHIIKFKTGGPGKPRPIFMFGEGEDAVYIPKQKRTIKNREKREKERNEKMKTGEKISSLKSNPVIHPFQQLLRMAGV